MIGIYYNGEESGVVYDYGLFHSKTFSPDSEWIVLGTLKSKWTYRRKKIEVRELAIATHAFISEYDVPLSWGDVAEIGTWFEKYGRRYGLLEEFRENGIC